MLNADETCETADRELAARPRRPGVLSSSGDSSAGLAPSGPSLPGGVIGGCIADARGVVGVVTTLARPAGSGGKGGNLGAAVTGVDEPSGSTCSRLIVSMISSASDLEAACTSANLSASKAPG